MGMDLAGMVQMGEYSNGCICQVRGKTLTAPQAAAGIAEAVAGVEMQRQLDEAFLRDSNQHPLSRH